MGEVLSQQEIDSLLQALTTGEIAFDKMKTEQVKGEVKLYDFKNPKKFSQDQIRTLSIIYENLARELSSILSTSLRLGLSISVATVEQVAYQEFLRSRPDPTVMGVFSMRPLEGLAVVEIDSTLHSVLLDRMLGGAGKKVHKLQRALTEIEQQLFISQFFHRFLSCTREAWSNVQEIKTQFEQLESSPQVVQIVSPNEIIALVTLSGVVGDEKGFISVGIPYLMLEPITPKLTTRFWFSSMTQVSREKDRGAVEKRLLRARMPVSVLLGKTDIAVGDVLELSVGDVLKLDNRIDESVHICVAERPKFVGLPGTVGKHLAVQISGIAEGGEI